MYVQVLQDNVQLKNSVKTSLVCFNTVMDLIFPISF